MYETLVNVIAYSAAFEAIEDMTEFGAKGALYRLLGYFNDTARGRSYLVHAISMNSWGPVASYFSHEVVAPSPFTAVGSGVYDTETDTISWG